jgi:hypothetical protein
MNKVKALVSAVPAMWRLIARYPALSGALADIIITIAAKFGFQLDEAQIAGVAGFLTALFGVLVTAGVVPVTKVANVKAGLKNTVPHKNVMLTSAISEPRPSENTTVKPPASDVPVIEPPEVEQASKAANATPDDSSRLGKPIRPTQKRK